MEDQRTEINTPWGGIKSKRTAELITIILAIVVGVLAYAFHVHGKTSDENEKAVVRALEKFSESQERHTKALRVQTCVFAQSNERRDQEFRDPNSFCNRL